MVCKWLLASENTEHFLTSRAYLDKSSSHFTATNADGTSLLTDMITLPLTDQSPSFSIPSKAFNMLRCLFLKYIA